MKRAWKRVVLLALAALWMFCVTASAEGASGDNSLYSLGLENATSCSPDFYYSTLEYNVTVPEGTEELYLSPITSNSGATILDISGTVLDEAGKSTVYITVEAPNGAQVSYVLYVTSDGVAAETEAETEVEAEDAAAAEQAAYEAELKAQAESEAALRREAEMKANEEKITKLSAENEGLVERMNILLKVLYGLVAFAVILLFFIINQSLRNKDLKDDLKEARMQADSSYEFARKEQNMRTDYYYAPVNAMPQKNIRGGQMQNTEANNMQAIFGNAPQRTQAQQMPNQAYGRVQEPTPVAEPVVPKASPVQEMPMPGMTAPMGMPSAAEMPVPTAPTENLSKRELKKLEKANKKAAKANRNAEPVQQAPVQPQQPMQDVYVQATLEEPDVNVDMIEL